MKRSYTKEFKVQACELVLNEGIKPAVVAEKFEINTVMLYRWVDEYRTYGTEAFVGKGHQKSAGAEVRKLKKENERLKMENEILKKQRHTLRSTRTADRIRQSTAKGLRYQQSMSDDRGIEKQLLSQTRAAQT